MERYYEIDVRCERIALIVFASIVCYYNIILY